MVWWIAATMCAFFVKGLCGFADAMILTTVMSFRVDNAMISPISLLLAYPGNALIAWRERRGIDWKLCLPLIAIVAAGSVPGILLLKNADTGVLKLLFGAVIVLLGVEMLLRERAKEQAKESKLMLLVIGILSGVLCGLYGIGAMLSAYISRVKKDSGAFKGNLCAVFFAENTIRIVLYIALGVLTLGQLKMALMLLPFMLLGLAAGMASARVLSERIVRRLVILLLIFSGASLFIGQLPI